jgi:hypothetical protein
MDNTTLISIISSHRRDSLGYESGELSQERAAAMDHYHGRPYGNEVTGRSAVVSRDLAETVDWALPAIIRVFIQSGNLAEFSPVGPEDEELAQQETDYTNQVIMKDNAGFMILHDAIKDTLLLKNGYVKHWWDVEEKITDEDYSGLTMDSLTAMIQELESYGAEVEIKGQESRIVDTPAGPVELFDVKLQVKKKCGKVRIEAVPAEEVRVSRKCKGSLQQSPFTEHVTKKTRSDLIEMGMDRNFVDSLPAFNEEDNSRERLARDSVTDENRDIDTSFSDKSMDEIEFAEAYLKVDYDDDGVAELRKVVTVAGNKIPPGDEWNEAITAVPLTSFVMKRVPHRHVGESLDDELADIQEIKTALERQLLDNVYLTNNQRIAANERVNYRDLMTSTPGGIVRVKGSEAIGDSLEPIQTMPILDKILPAIDYWDKTKEIRSGIRPGSDMDPDMLSNVTKGGFFEAMNRLSEKIEMMTRMLAESGVKDMVLMVHDLLIRNQDQQRVVQMRGKWVPVNPKEWKERTDLTLKVGLGTGNKEQKRQDLGMLFQMQQAVLQAATSAPPPVYARVYALFSDLAKTMGVDVPEKYAVPPGSPEHMQMQQQASQQQNPQMAKVQADSQAEQARLQQEGMLRQSEMRMQAQVDAHRQQVEAQQQQARMTMELQLERQRNEMDMQLAREKAQMQAQIDVMLARIKAEAQIDAAQITAQATLSQQQETAADNAVGDEA